MAIVKNNIEGIQVVLVIEYFSMKLKNLAGLNGCGAITTLAPKYICVKNCELLQYPKYIGSTMSDLSSSFNFKDLYLILHL